MEKILHDTPMGLRIVSTRQIVILQRGVKFPINFCAPFPLSSPLSSLTRSNLAVGDYSQNLSLENEVILSVAVNKSLLLKC